MLKTANFFQKQHKKKLLCFIQAEIRKLLCGRLENAVFIKNNVTVFDIIATEKLFQMLKYQSEV